MSRYQHNTDEARILRAIANMPYGVLVTNRIDPHDRVGFNSATMPCQVHLHDVATYLETLTKVLDEFVNDDKCEIARLLKVESDVMAMRRVLGIGDK